MTQPKLTFILLFGLFSISISLNAQAALFSAGQLEKECAIAVKIEKHELPKNNETMLPALNCIRFIDGVRQARLAFAIKANKENLTYAQTHYGNVNNGERVLSIYNYLKTHTNSTNATKPAGLAVLTALNQSYPLKAKLN